MILIHVCLSLCRIKEVSHRLAPVALIGDFIQTVIYNGVCIVALTVFVVLVFVLFFQIIKILCKTIRIGVIIFVITLPQAVFLVICLVPKHLFMDTGPLVSQNSCCIAVFFIQIRGGL